MTADPEWTVCVPEPIAEAGLDRLREFARVVDLSAEANPDAARSLIVNDEVEAVVVRTLELDAETIASSERLRVIAKHGVGLDNIDVEAASANGIYVTRTPGENVTAAAEHTIGMLLALRKQFVRATRDIEGGEWDRTAYVAPELAGDTLGIIGLGAIGRAVADRAACLGMTVVGVDPYLDPADAPDFVELLDSVFDVATAADALTVHTPLTEETAGAIGHAEIEQLPSTGIVLNCARGGIVDEDALAVALADGRIAGAGLDVFSSEPIPASHPLLAHDNVIVTPHCAGSSEEALDGMATAAAESIHDVFRGNIPAAAVNADAVNGDHGR